MCVCDWLRVWPWLYANHNYYSCTHTHRPACVSVCVRRLCTCTIRNNKPHQRVKFIWNYKHKQTERKKTEMKTEKNKLIQPARFSQGKHTQGFRRAHITFTNVMFSSAVVVSTVCPPQLHSSPALLPKLGFSGSSKWRKWLWAINPNSSFQNISSETSDAPQKHCGTVCGVNSTFCFCENV